MSIVEVLLTTSKNCQGKVAVVAMESHVLIPEDFCLASRTAAELCSSPSVARLLEQGVAVVAAADVAKGKTFSPTDGTLRIGRLDVYSTLQDSDVSAMTIMKIAFGLGEMCAIYSGVVTKVQQLRNRPPFKSLLLRQFISISWCLAASAVVSVAFAPYAIIRAACAS